MSLEVGECAELHRLVPEPLDGGGGVGVDQLLHHTPHQQQWTVTAVVTKCGQQLPQGLQETAATSLELGQCKIKQK